MVLTQDVNQRTLRIPELKQVGVMWEEVYHGIGVTKPHMRTAYVLYTNPEDGTQIISILEENDGIGYNFTPYIYNDCEGSHTITRERVLELISLESLQLAEQRMQAIILLLNTDEATYERQREVYAEDNNIYENDGQPTEQEELEDYEGEDLPAEEY